MARTSTRVPKLSGALAGAHYSLIAVAQDSETQDSAVDAGVDARRERRLDGGAVELAAAAQQHPGVAAARTRSARSAGATLHGGEIQDMTGERVWSITIFDGSTSFTLPGLSPDPLPAGC